MPRKLRELSLRDLVTVVLPLAAVVAAGFWTAAQFIKPAPPSTLVLSSGDDGGAYQYFAARYKPLLAKHGIALQERPSAGSIENLHRLLDTNSDVDVAFVQGGTAQGLDNTERLVSLGSLYPEPLWVFYRGKQRLDRLTQLQGKRLGVGPEGSGSRKLAIELLEANGIAQAPTQLLPLGGLDAASALANGQVDAIFLVGAAQSAAIWTMLYTPNVQLMSFARAEGYARRFSHLSTIVLPEGAIDFARNIPNRDVSLIAPAATLVAREDLHPALANLLLQVASEVHGEAGLFQKVGEFPQPKGVDFQLSSDAERYYKSGKPLLQRYLPFWAATLIDRMVVLLIPIFALLIPLMRVAPPLYRWRVSSRVYRWYGKLKFLEGEVEEHTARHSREEWLERLDEIEREASHITTPLAFADQLYVLREHIGLVREAILRKTQPTTG